MRLSQPPYKSLGKIEDAFAVKVTGGSVFSPFKRYKKILIGIPLSFILSGPIGILLGVIFSSDIVGVFSFLGLLIGIVAYSIWLHSRSLDEKITFLADRLLIQSGNVKAQFLFKQLSLVEVKQIDGEIELRSNRKSVKFQVHRSMSEPLAQKLQSLAREALIVQDSKLTGTGQMSNASQSWRALTHREARKASGLILVGILGSVFLAFIVNGLIEGRRPNGTRAFGFLLLALAGPLCIIFSLRQFWNCMVLRRKFLKLEKEGDLDGIRKEVERQTVSPKSPERTL